MFNNRLTNLIRSVTPIVSLLALMCPSYAFAGGAATLPAVERHDREVLYRSRGHIPDEFYKNSWADYWTVGTIHRDGQTYQSKWVAPGNQGCEDNRGITVTSWNIWMDVSSFGQRIWETTVFAWRTRKHEDERDDDLGLMSPCADVLLYQEAWKPDDILTDGPWADLQRRGYHAHTINNSYSLNANSAQLGSLHVGGGQSGLVAFVRHGTRIIKSAHQPFGPVSSSGKRKGFGILLVEKNGRFYYIANTHLNWGGYPHRGAEVGGQSAVRRKEWMKGTELMGRFLDANYLQYPPSGLLLAGDFNSDFVDGGPLRTGGGQLLSNMIYSGDTATTASPGQFEDRPKSGFEGQHYYTPAVIKKNALQNCNPTCESYLPAKVDRALNSSDPQFAYGRFTAPFTRVEKLARAFSLDEFNTNWTSGNDFATGGDYWLDAIVPVANTVNKGKWGICTPKSMSFSAAPGRWQGGGTDIILPRKGWSDHYAVWMHYVPSDDCGGGAGVIPRST